ncbi:MAG: YwiC-like family protein, partial [Longimicrobiales bacterium]|nr:YwiC-like family protein [Longimicrobiales bacterium]
MSGLMPREHGAYAQLGFPLATGLIYARGDLAGAGFAIAAAALFLAHEPVAVLAGVRGKRLQEQLRQPARRRVVALAAAAGLGLAMAVGLAPQRAWMAALVPGGLAILLLPLLGTRKLKSLPGETLVAAVFSTSLMPVALCGPVSWRSAVVAAAVWFAAVIPAILSVHAIKVAFKGRE